MMPKNTQLAPSVLETSATFPILYHGGSTVSVVVGKGYSSTSFTIHKDLLVYATPIFDAQLVEQHDQAVYLPQRCPCAFEAVYQYLYSGRLYSANFYSQSTMAADTFWFRVYQIATELELDELINLTLKILMLRIWNNKLCTTPSAQFIQEAYSDKVRSTDVWSFTVQATAYHIAQSKRLCNFKKWQRTIEACPAFATEVMLKICQAMASGSKVIPQNPLAMTDFSWLTEAEPPMQIQQEHGDKVTLPMR